jgi:hypothetical protein
VLGAISGPERFFLVIVVPLLFGALFGIFELGWRQRRISLALLLLAMTIIAVLMGLTASGLRLPITPN